MRSKAIGIVVVLVALVASVGWQLSARAAQPDAIWEGDPQLTDEMRAWVEACRMTPGVHIGVFGGVRLVVIAAGEKPTAGYAVIVEDVVKTGQAIVVRARLQGPQGGMVAQVVTYPYAVIGIKGHPDTPIRVQDAATGNVWPSGSGS